MLTVRLLVSDGTGWSTLNMLHGGQHHRDAFLAEINQRKIEWELSRCFVFDYMRVVVE